MFHGAYLDFFERARTEWLRALGFDLCRLQGTEGILFIVRRLEVAYRRPARLDDLLEVTAELCALGRAQLSVHQQVLRAGEVLAQAKINLACVKVRGLRPAPLPARFRERLQMMTSMSRTQSRGL